MCNEKYDMKQLGKRIRLARFSLNLTQKQLAEAIHASPNSIAQIERGTRNASDKLLYQIAVATGTTIAWLKGESDVQTDYPQINPDVEQINGDSASLGYLASILQNEFTTHKEWSLHLPADKFSFAKIEWIPDYWIYVENSPIRRWAFDFSFCIYKREDALDKIIPPTAKLAFTNFIANVAFSYPLVRNETKFTFVVSTNEQYDQCLRDVAPIGNISLMQIDIPAKKVLRETYLCTLNRDRNALNMLKF